MWINKLKLFVPLHCPRSIGSAPRTEILRADFGSEGGEMRSSSFEGTFIPVIFYILYRYQFFHTFIRFFAQICLMNLLGWVAGWDQFMTLGASFGKPFKRHLFADENIYYFPGQKWDF
jgi:hypothetical protein